MRPRGSRGDDGARTHDRLGVAEMSTQARPDDLEMLVAPPSVVQPAPEVILTGVREASRRRLARAMERLREQAAARPPV